MEWLIKDIQKTIEGKNYDYIEYNRITYGNVPFWVMIQAISFGKISKMFGFMQQSIQQKICNEYPNIQINEMENMLKVLTKFRNVCAHNERLYEYKTKDSLKDMHIHKALQLPKRKGGAGYRNGSRDLYSVVIVFKCLLAEEEFAKFYEELQKMMSEFHFKTSTINKKLVFDAMGFPKNWAEIIRATNQKQEIHKKC